MVSVIPSSRRAARTFEDEEGFKLQPDPSTPTELWEAAMREKGRREQQRRRMVNWRRLKKEKKAEMLQERRILEKELQLRVREARVARDQMQVGSISEAYRQSLVECAALTSENMALREAIQHQATTKNRLQQEAQEFLEQLRPVDSTQTIEMLALHGEAEWRVQFPNNEPYFYFTPFTKAEYGDILERSDFADRHPCIATVGKILGWTVHFNPLTENAPGESFMARARFTRRLRCSLDESWRILPRLDKNLWPVLVTPRSWELTQSGDMFCQVLQDFSENGHVDWREDKYILTIGDSQANARNRDVEGPRDDVQWVLEGGVCITITEMDESTIDVVFDQWAGCLSEKHGRRLYIDWIKFPVDLEQYIVPARLLGL
ncbi:hypothetical protein ON010_g751 [Phytophthora cinnamomi]|nr:hypothetical protein ON010_g751 [Phytophthora cinnamomi]